MVQNLSQIVGKYDTASRDLKSLVDIFRSINQAKSGQQPLTRPKIQKSVSPPKSSSKIIDGFVKKAEQNSIYGNVPNVPNQRALQNDNQMSFAQL